MAVRNGDGVAIPAPCEWDGRVLFAGNYADYKPFNFVDGEGVRCSLYVSGCPFKCPECYNRAAQSFRYGRPYTAELEERILADLAQPYVAGLSLVGGEPMLATPVLCRCCDPFASASARARRPPGMCGCGRATRTSRFWRIPR